MSPILLGSAVPQSEEWHALRHDGIGASEIAAVLGLSPWLSPFTLWHVKAGTVEPDYSGNAATHWGTLHEPTIAAEWAREHPWADVQQSATYARHDDPWMLANPDREIVDGAELVGVLEIKTARSADGWGPDGSDEIPVAYRCQVMQQMHVMEVPVAHVAVLIGGSDFRCYTVDYDEAEARLLADTGRAFWQSIADGTPPDIDASASTATTVRRLHPDVDDTECPVPADLAADYRAAVAAAREADAAKEHATSRLLDAMGSARVAVDPDGVKVATRSVSTPQRFDRAALRKEHPDLEKKYTVAGQPAVRLTPSRTETKSHD